MKTITNIFLFLFLVTFSKNIYSQQLITIEKGCAFYNTPESKEVYVRECKSEKVLKIIDDILSVISLERNFELYEANVENAIAFKIGSRRIILVDPVFLEAIEKQSKNRYTSYLIIAHEIGHHLNSHIDKSNKDSEWWDELEADHFAGSVIQKLGMPALTFNSVMNLIAPQMAELGGTHPEWQARMKATINGYCQSYFVEVKRNIKVGQMKNSDIQAKILVEEKNLENILNENIYKKYDWERNVKYRVINRNIYKESEISLNDPNGKFSKSKDTLSIYKLSHIKLKWHDPGEIDFESSNHSLHEVLQGKEAIKRLDPNSYFDDEITIQNDLNILIKLTSAIARIQKYSESLN